MTRKTRTLKDFQALEEQGKLTVEDIPALLAVWAAEKHMMINDHRYFAQSYTHVKAFGCLYAFRGTVAEALDRGKRVLNAQALQGQERKRKRRQVAVAEQAGFARQYGDEIDTDERS